MNRQEQFSILFRKYGKPVQVNELPSETKKRYEEQIGFYNAFDPTIYVGALENMSFNAVATKNDIGEFIALYMGAITQLTLYAYQVFSDPDLFKDMGDVSLEKCENRIIDILKKGDIFRASELRYLPNDPKRRNVAERIAECSCLILFLHEAGHIRGCHIDIILNELGISAYQEFNINPINEEESLLLRALELEADMVALANSLSIWRDLVERTGIHDVEVLGPTRSWLIAAELLFWVMSVNHNKSRANRLASHPSVLTRYLNIRLILRKQDEEDKELIDAFRQPGNTLLPWIAKHNLSSSILDYYQKDTFEDADITEWVELQQRIKTILPKLEEYQYARSKRLGI